MYAERNSRLTKGPASDRIHRLSRQWRTECDLTSIQDMDDQSLRGQALRRSDAELTSHGITFSRHDVLGASHTRKASPLLAGESTGSLPHRATQLPDKEFRSCLPWTCPSGRHSLRCRSLHVAMQMGPYHRPQAEGVWRMVSEDSRYLSGSFLLIVRTRRIVTVDKLPTSSA